MMEDNNDSSLSKIKISIRKSLVPLSHRAISALSGINGNVNNRYINCESFMDIEDTDDELRK